MRSGREHRHLEPAQRVGVALDQRPVEERAGGRRGGKPHRPGQHHTSSVRTDRRCPGGSVSDVPAELKTRLQADLNAAMKARDEVTTATLRMALTAITNEEVAGKSARELDDDEVLRVLGREAKKRREAAEAFDGAGRSELASRERAEGEVLAHYLPEAMGEDELRDLVAAAIAEAGAASPRDMGAVMKLVQPRIAGRADGKRVSDEVRR